MSLTRSILSLYIIAKRTVKGPEVCGHLKVSIAARVDGDEVITPFYQQYMKLHEVGGALIRTGRQFTNCSLQQLFLHCHLNNSEPLIAIPINVRNQYHVRTLVFIARPPLSASWRWWRVLGEVPTFRFTRSYRWIFTEICSRACLQNDGVRQQLLRVCLQYDTVELIT